MTNRELITLALKARENAYAPYSGFRVGSALVGKSGKVYSGCNVENASYSSTNCAERTAVFKAISEGEKEFVSIAIVGGKEDSLSDFCAPCGVCRQVLAEFCKEDFQVVLATPENFQSYSLSELLPHSFGKKNLE
jgi:cytidine deaminase